MVFSYGIEHEISFLKSDGTFADFSNTHFEDFTSIIDALPLYPEDYTQLRIGDAGIRHKRWYIEGIERFDLAGNLLYCIPKGIEIRTLIHPKIDDAIEQLTACHDQLRQACIPNGFTPILTSHNPTSPPFELDPPLNEYEIHKHSVHSLQKLLVPMMTFGPDLNISAEGLSDAQLVDIAQKLIYYSPYIIPFSFSSPFTENTLWKGLSKRTHIRAAHRPAVIVYLKNSTCLTQSLPMYTKKARLPAEIGRIEFKSFDSCGDFTLYASLLALLKGLILDDTLLGRSELPDVALHQVSALEGFTNQHISEIASTVLTAASTALHNDADENNDPDQKRLGLLYAMLHTKQSPASLMMNYVTAGNTVLSAARKFVDWKASDHFAAYPIGVPLNTSFSDSR